MAKDGRFEPGTVVVVEAWDRLGRLRPDQMTQLVAELVQTGLAIGVCRLDELFSEDDFGTHKWTTLAVFIQLAFQESKQKAERVAASWQKRREQAREGAGAVNGERDGRLRLGSLPAWLQSAGGKVRLIPDRAAVVRRIFKLAANGYGHTRIVKTLVADSVPAFGEVRVNEGRGRSQFSGKWTRPYVAIILNDRRAIGEKQPCRADGTADGPPLADYYPAVVSQGEFLLARAGQAKRLGKDRRGRSLVDRQSKYVNTFKGLLRHARDGEGWVLHNKGTAAKPELILVTATSEGGRGPGYTFPYPVFEEAILSRLKEVDPTDVLPDAKAEANRADALRAQLAAARQDMADLKADLVREYSKALASVLREREAAEEKTAEALQEELAKSARPAERAWKDLPSLVDLIRRDGDDGRLKVRGVLNRVIEGIWVLIVPRGSYRACAVQVCFTGGGRRSYLITHQTAGYARAGGWSCRTFADDVPRGDSLDFRKRRDAAKLVRELERLVLDERK
jgi:hypothetical protein